MSCCICISTIKYNSNIIQCHQCQQIYHQKCYMKWYKYNNNINQCPHCNFKSNNEIIITQYIPNELELSNSFSNLDDIISSSSSDDDSQIIPIIEDNIIGDIDNLYPNRNNHNKSCCFVFTCLFFLFGTIFLLYFNKLDNDHRKYE